MTNEQVRIFARTLIYEMFGDGRCGHPYGLLRHEAVTALESISVYLSAMQQRITALETRIAELEKTAIQIKR